MNHKPDVSNQDDWYAEQYTRMQGAWEMLSGILHVGLMMEESVPADQQRLPLFVLSGFLGAGKTTLVNQLLTQDHGKHLVVLVNDFAKLNIDSRLIKSREADTISLTNGCVCCSMADDLARQLQQLARRSSTVDGVILESSGVSDPHGIAQIALAVEAVDLAAVITVIDAEAWREQVSHPVTRMVFRAQVEGADLIVLNKSDLVDAESLQEAREMLKRFIPNAPVYETVQACLPAMLLFERNDAMLNDRRAWRAPVTTPALGSWTVSVSYALDEGKVRDLLGSLPDGILRAKGVLQLHRESLFEVLYQRVGRRWTLTPLDSGTDAIYDSKSHLVFIGPMGTLDQDFLQAQLDACQVKTS